jgi:hypothetical protein
MFMGYGKSPEADAVIDADQENWRRLIADHEEIIAHRVTVEWRGAAQRRRRRFLANLGALIFAVGLVLLVGAPLVWMQSRPTPDVGVPPLLATEDGPTVASQSPVDPAPDGPDGTGAREAPDDSPDGADVAGGADASPYPVTSLRGGMDPARWPTAVAIAALDVRAPVMPVGLLAATGELVVPPSPMDVGWYQRSSEPGDGGVTLLTSHVDTRAEGRGVFAGLVRLMPGDLIELTLGDGTTSRWEVVAREQHPKAALPTTVFARTGPPTLALVTCGGTFDRTTRSYSDNVIVWAVPATA